MQFRRFVAVVALLVLVLSAFAAPAGAAGNPNPGIAPPDSHPHGSTYGEWNARWWQWAVSVPVPVNPVLDTTGAHCAEGQSGQVWFLAGTFGGSATRSCTISAGKALLFPLVNCEASNADTGPGNFTIDQLRAFCANPPTGVLGNTLTASIDGVALTNLTSYRAISPLFNYTIPNDNLFQHFGIPLSAGTYGPTVADGFYLFVNPLPPGKHVIHFSSAGITNLDVTYNLTILPG